MQTLAPRVRPIGGPAKNPDQYGTVVGCEAVAGEENAVSLAAQNPLTRVLTGQLLAWAASLELDDEKRAIVIDCCRRTASG